MHIEVFSAPVCRKCSKVLEQIEAILHELEDDKIKLSKVDIVKQLDYAVEMGLLATPAIAIDGELVFTTMPSENALREAIESHLK